MSAPLPVSRCRSAVPQPQSRPWYVPVLVAALAAVSACATTPPAPPEPSEPPVVFARFSVHPPQGEGWILSGRSENGVLYGRRLSPTHTALALGVEFDAKRPITRQDDVVHLLEANWAEKARDVSRYRNQSSHAEPLAAFGKRCVRYHLRSDDHGAVNKGDAPFLHQLARGLVCYDPRNPDRLVRVAYSERSLPEEVNPDFDKDADTFLNGLELNGTP